MDRWEKPPKDGSKPAVKSTTDNKDQKVVQGNLGGEAITIHWRINTWFPDLSEDVKKKLKILHDDLLKFNKTNNLISIKTIGHADAIHFADSILASKAIYSSMNIDEIYDFGSGNGFPGVVFALMYAKNLRGEGLLDEK